MNRSWLSYYEWKPTLYLMLGVWAMIDANSKLMCYCGIALILLTLIILAVRIQNRRGELRLRRIGVIVPDSR